MGDKDEEIGLSEREQASDKDKDKEEREEEGRSCSDFLSSGSSTTVTEMKERMRSALSDVRQWDFRVSRIGGWIIQYLKGDTVTQRLAMDTVAQDLQK